MELWRLSMSGEVKYIVTACVGLPRLVSQIVRPLIDNRHMGDVESDCKGLMRKWIGRAN